MVSKQKLTFDATDVDTIAASDSVGAFLRASDGTLLTHTDVGGKKALDVRLAEGVNVEVDLAHTDDSVRLGDGTSFFTSTSENGDVALDVHISNTSIEVTATALDIRPLTNADVVTIEDGGGSITIDGTVAATQSGVWDIGTVTTLTSITNDVNIADGGNSITVDAVQLDIDDLNATDDAVAAWAHDGAGNAIGSTSNALDVYVTGSANLTVSDAALANTAIASAANPLGVADTAEDVVASPLANRKYLLIMNNSNKNIYVGASGVTAANGFPLSPQAVMELRAGAAVDIEFVAASAGQEVRTLELS